MASKNQAIALIKERFPSQFQSQSEPKTTSYFPSKMIDRESQVKSFLEIVYHRWKDYKRHVSNPDIDLRKINPHISIQSSPGGGKTYFVKHFLDPENIERHLSSGILCQYLFNKSRSSRLAVSRNDAQKYFEYLHHV